MQKVRRLEEIEGEHNRAVIDTQLDILQNCARGKKGYDFHTDNSRPVYRAGLFAGEGPSPPSSYAESAPNWKPQIKKLASWILKGIKSGKIRLPLQKNNPLERQVVVPDRNGLINVELYISDNGINCVYRDYNIVNHITPFMGRPENIRELERNVGPFYTWGTQGVSHNLLILKNKKTS